MYSGIEMPVISRIISCLTPEGGCCGEKEFCSSSHPNRREMLIPLQGCCRYMMKNSVYTFAPGTAGLISPGMIHAADYTPRDHDLLHLWIHFTGTAGMYGIVLKVTEAGKYGKIDLKNNPVRFPGYLEQLILKRWKELEKCSPGEDDKALALMQLPCQLLLNELELQWNGILTPQKGQSLSVFLQSYIRSCLGNGCSIARLAELSGYSPSHVSHVFVKETGESVGAFINSVRIAHTRESLKQGIRQKVIAQELGFASPAAFWNWMQSIPELKKR